MPDTTNEADSGCTAFNCDIYAQQSNASIEIYINSNTAMRTESVHDKTWTPVSSLVTATEAISQFDVNVIVLNSRGDLQTSVAESLQHCDIHSNQQHI